MSELSPADPGLEPATTTDRETSALDIAPEAGHRDRILRALGIAWSTVGVVFLTVQVTMFFDPTRPPVPITDIFLEVLVIPTGPIVLWSIRSDRRSFAAWLVIGLAFFGASMQLFVEGLPTADVAGKLGLLMTVAVAFVLLKRHHAAIVLAASSVVLIIAHVLFWIGAMPPPIPRDRFGQIVFSLVAWLAAAGILAAVLYSTMSALRQQARVLRQRVQDLTLLHGVGSQIARSLDVEDILATAVQALQRTFNCDSVVILVPEEGSRRLRARAAAGKHADVLPSDHTQGPDEGLIGWVAARGQSVLVNNVEADPRYVNDYPDQVSTQSELCIPIRTGDEIAGVLDVQSDLRDAFDEADQRTLETLAGQIAVAIENARLYEAERDARDQLRDLVTYIQSAQEAERTHIAREILDEFGQLMAGLQMNLAWLRQRLTKSQGALTEKTHTMANIIDESIHVVRRLSGELRPSVLDHFGLVAAIRWQADAFAERTGITPQVRLDLDTDLVDPKLSTALFRILQEALSNVVLHAEATQVFIRLRLDEQRVALNVQDDGRGIMPEEADGARSLGLVGMRERARALGGDVTIDGIPGRGTTVTATIPRSEAQEHTYRGA